MKATGISQVLMFRSWTLASGEKYELPGWVCLQPCSASTYLQHVAEILLSNLYHNQSMHHLLGSSFLQCVGSSLSTPLLICVWQTKFIQYWWMLFKSNRVEDDETRRPTSFPGSFHYFELRDLVVASTRPHRARLLKYYARPLCAPSFVNSRMPRPLQPHFLLIQQIFFILVCIHAGNPRMPPRVLV